MNITYSSILPNSDRFYKLYKSTGWDLDAPKNKEILYKALSNSWCFVFAYDNDKLVGCGRVLSDGYLHAYINEMIVDPEYQGLGIGKEIINQLLYKVKNADINDIQLFCAKGKKEFYIKNNFVERPNDAPGMQYRIK